MVQKQKSSRKSAVGGDTDVPIASDKPQRAQKSVVGSAEMTEENFGGGSSDNDDGEDDAEEGMGDGGSSGDEDGADFFKARSKKEKGLAPIDEDEDDEFAKFYREMTAAGEAKSAKRKERYTVAPRVAGAHVAAVGPAEKRAASYQIIKNRGLVASKSKINRNPRVKKKEQFRKATIKRKGQVRDIRDSAEGASYGGEATGIKANISRSRKITN
jgi:U3 small nucleolar RNA-associated protein 3